MRACVSASVHGEKRGGELWFIELSQARAHARTHARMHACTAVVLMPKPYGNSLSTSLPSYHVCACARSRGRKNNKCQMFDKIALFDYLNHRVGNELG